MHQSVTDSNRTGKLEVSESPGKKEEGNKKKVHFA